MELDELARGLATFEGRVASAMNSLDSLNGGPAVFGGNGPGQLGEVGRALAGQHYAAIAARRHEAGQVATVVDDLADAVAKAAVNYRDLEDRRGGSR